MRDDDEPRFIYNRREPRLESHNWEADVSVFWYEDKTSALQRHSAAHLIRLFIERRCINNAIRPKVTVMRSVYTIIICCFHVGKWFTACALLCVELHTVCEVLWHKSEVSALRLTPYSL